MKPQDFTHPIITMYLAWYYSVNYGHTETYPSDPADN